MNRVFKTVREMRDMKIFKIIIILLVTTYIANPAYAKTNIEAGWVKEVLIGECDKGSTLPIQIFTKDCELNTAKKEKIKKGIVFLYNFFHTAFGLNYDKPFEIKIRFFGNFKDFKAYQKQVSDSTSDSDAGFHSKKTTNEIVIFFRDNELENDNILYQSVNMMYHEATHFFIYYHFYRLPMWIEEGLAEYLRGIRIENDNVIIAYGANEEAWLKYWLANGKLVSLKTYIDMPYEDWKNYNKRLFGAGYITSWSLFYFSMSTKENRDIIKDILCNLRDTQNWEQPSLAFNKYYPGGIKQMEKDWVDWFMQPRREHLYNLSGEQL